MKTRFIAAVFGAALFAAACADSPTTVGPNFVKTGGSPTVAYVGQGLTQDLDGSYFLTTEICGLANGADVDGPYMLWVLTATGATSATITFATGGSEDGTHAMTKVSAGSFKYVSAWLNPTSLLPNKVTATYAGKVTNAQLVVSHGCRPFTTEAAWCSPGFWGHVDAVGYGRLGVDPTVQTYNLNVFPFGTNFANSFSGFAVDPTLTTVLTTSGNTYKGDPGDYTFSNSLGTLFGANVFNATGAYLTSLIPDNPFTGTHYAFDPSLVGGTEACPIDNHGDYKVTQ